MAAATKGYFPQILAVLKPAPKAASDASDPIPRIRVNDAVGRFAFLYERIRNAIDYNDEHLIRKTAIVRIMKRQLMLEVDPDVIANHLVRELIAARYLPNGVLPESIISVVSVCIKKLQAISKIHAGSDTHIEWLRGIVAVEIEDVLVDAAQEKALVTFLYERLADSLVIRGAEMDDTERKLQIYVACYRSLVRADDEMLGFKLLRAYLPEWLRPDEWLDDPRPIAERLVAVHQRIRLALKHPLSQRFLRAVKPWAVSLSLFRDAVLEKPDKANELVENPDQLNLAITRKAEDRYRKAKGKLRRGTMRAILYLFVTKMLVAFVLEVPLEYAWYKTVNTTTLGINLLFPPILMFIVGLMIRVPGRDNTERLKTGVRELFADAPIPVREIRAPRAKSGLRSVVFPIVYAITFVISFGITAFFLSMLDFTWISAAIFIFFLCVVSFFAFRLRQTAREVVVVEGRDRLSSMVMDFFSMPILRAGQWLSRSISRINVFLFFFDFLFEAPFKIFLQILEEWFAFMKEKKEDLQ